MQLWMIEKRTMTPGVMVLNPEQKCTHSGVKTKLVETERYISVGQTMARDTSFLFEKDYTTMDWNH